MGDTGSTSSHYIVNTGGLIVTDPDLPVLCYLKTKVQGILFTFMYSIVGKFCVSSLFLYLHKNICCLSLLWWLLLASFGFCEV